jgi:hypothetical protein
LREYPRGATGAGDVDSGPLIFGLSPISTGVGLVAARANGDVELFERLIQLGEVAGLPVTLDGAKRYSLGQLMVGDAFLAWGKTWVPWRSATGVPAAADLPRLTPRLHVWAYAIAALWAAAALAPLLSGASPNYRGDAAWPSLPSPGGRGAGGEGELPQPSSRDLPDELPGSIERRDRR